MDQLGLLQQANNAWHNREIQRYEFVLDYLKMCTVADIPLEMTQKMRPVLQKHCKQEVLSTSSTYTSNNICSKALQDSFSALQALLRNQPVSVTADKTTCL